MRERVEDLGRILERLEDLYEEHPLFQRGNSPRRPKDYEEWWGAMNEESKLEMVSTWVYAIQSLREEIGYLIEIASGQDIHNREDG